MTEGTEAAIEILGRLVSFDTTSAKSNLDMIEHVRAYLEDLGVAATVIPDETGMKANLFATIGDPSLPGIVLSGHTDVVPVEGQTWTRAPFVLTREDGRLYGRGTTDMKGFVACMMAIAPALKAADLKIPVHLAFTYDEEVGCLGIGSLIGHMTQAVAPPVAAFVGEPSEMKVIDSHKGSRGLVTVVTGKACHSSRVDLGVNAIVAAGRIFGEIERIGAELAAQPDPEARYSLPYTTVSVGVVRGGTARNLIAGDCTFQWDIRSTTPEGADETQHRIADFVDGTVLPAMRADFEGSAVETKIVYDVPALVAAPGSEAARLAKHLAASNETSSVDYGTEAGFFVIAGIPSVVCGPGRDTEAHIADEWIEVDQIDRCMRFLAGLVSHVSR